MTGYADRVEHREEIFDFSKYPAEPNWDTYNRHMDSVIRDGTRKIAGQVRQQAIDFIRRNKEEPTMQVSYNGFTGELVKLERVGTGKIAETIIPIDLPGASCEHVWFYNLSIYDREKKVTHSFTGVKLKDVKFLGGAVSFGG